MNRLKGISTTKEKIKDPKRFIKPNDMKNWLWAILYLSILIGLIYGWRFLADLLPW